MTRIIVDRREVMRIIGATAVSLGGPASSLAADPFRAYPFTLGIASGDPAADGFVIWTRLAPDPFNGGGMPARVVPVAYEIAGDAGFRTILRSGQVEARPEAAHSVHVEIGGLEPGRSYFYRFSAGGVQSPAGQARTLPAPGAEPARLRFAAIGCQRWEHGYYTAFRHMAAEELDFAFHYGDYIYEYAQFKGMNPNYPLVRPMPQDYPEARTLADYRNRYAVYKSDADLQAAHASTAFIATFDDHEVANNWREQFVAGVVQPRPTAAFLQRRAAAFQAWYEHMPVRRTLKPQGSSILAYRRLAIGDLATFHVLDTRQYRSAQPCDDGWKACTEARDPARGLLGQQQENWLYDGFRASRTRWNILAQQVMMMQCLRAGEGGATESHMDRWDGAVAGRDRLFAALAAARLPGVVTLTGDIHNNWAGDLKQDFRDEKSATLGVEFIATSITSGGDGSDGAARLTRLASLNPHIRFFNNQRGYVVHTVTRERWQADFRVVDKVSVRDGMISTRQSLVSERLAPGVKQA